MRKQVNSPIRFLNDFFLFLNTLVIEEALWEGKDQLRMVVAGSNRNILWLWPKEVTICIPHGPSIFIPLGWMPAHLRPACLHISKAECLHTSGPGCLYTSESRCLHISEAEYLDTRDLGAHTSQSLDTCTSQGMDACISQRLDAYIPQGLKSPESRQLPETRGNLVTY